MGPYLNQVPAATEGEPVWYTPALERLSPGQIRQRLARCPPPAQDGFPPGFFCEPPAPAAVLLPLFRRGSRWHLLFIRRAESVNDRHGGQVAFPGGRVEPGDADAVGTALREAQEEVGLPPAAVRVLGCLDVQRTVSNFLVTPVVGLIPWPLSLAPDPKEVSRIFHIPLAWLGDPARHRQVTRPLGPAGGAFPVVYFDRYDGEVLWGVSARFTLRLIQVLAASSGGEADPAPDP